MLKIAIIEDNPQYRTTLSIILQLNENFHLLHKLANCDEMIGRFQVDQPEVVLMDINMPGMNGIEGVWEIKKYFPDIKVIMLTVFEEVNKIFGAIKAGANGYLLKKDSPPMNGVIAAKVLDYFQKQQKSNSELNQSNLTEREKEILNLLIKGNSYKEIAAGIYISVETLNSHIKNIYRKLNVHSRSELAAKYGSPG